MSASKLISSHRSAYGELSCLTASAAAAGPRWCADRARRPRSRGRCWRGSRRPYTAPSACSWPGLLDGIRERIAAIVPRPARHFLRPRHRLGDPFLGELRGHGEVNRSAGRSLAETDALCGPVTHAREQRASAPPAFWPRRCVTFDASGHTPGTGPWPRRGGGTRRGQRSPGAGLVSSPETPGRELGDRLREHADTPLAGLAGAAVVARCARVGAVA